MTKVALIGPCPDRPTHGLTPSLGLIPPSPESCTFRTRPHLRWAELRRMSAVGT